MATSASAGLVAVPTQAHIKQTESMSRLTRQYLQEIDLSAAWSGAGTSGVRTSCISDQDCEFKVSTTDLPRGVIRGKSGRWGEES